VVTCEIKHGNYFEIILFHI